MTTSTSPKRKHRSSIRSSSSAVRSVLSAEPEKVCSPRSSSSSRGRFKPGSDDLTTNWHTKGPPKESLYTRSNSVGRVVMPPRYLMSTTSSQQGSWKASKTRVDPDREDPVRWPECNLPNAAQFTSWHAAQQIDENPSKHIAFQIQSTDSQAEDVDMAGMALEGYAWESEDALTYAEFLTMLEDIEPDTAIGEWFTPDLFTLAINGRGEDPSKGMTHRILSDVFSEWFFHDILKLNRVRGLLSSKSEDSRSLRSLKSLEEEVPGFMKPTQSFIASSPKMTEEQERRDETTKRRAEREQRKRDAMERRHKKRTRTPPRRAEDWKQGETVMVRDSEGEPWKQGSIISITGGKPSVMPKGFTKPHFWKQVKRIKAESEGSICVTGASKALFIGIDYIDTPAEIQGSIHDTKDLERILKKHGFNVTKRVLTDDILSKLPTRANILDGLRWLVEGCSEGDSLFLSFCGLNTVRCDETTTGIVPCDYTTAGVISSDIIASIVLCGIPPGARLTILADCRYGGSILSLPNEISVTPNGTYTLKEDNPATLPSNIGEIFSISSNRKRLKALDDSCLVQGFSACTNRTDPLVGSLLSEMKQVISEKLGSDNVQLPVLQCTHRIDLHHRWSLGIPRMAETSTELQPRDSLRTLSRENLRVAARDAAIAQAKAQKKGEGCFNWKGLFGWLPPPLSRRMPDYLKSDTWVMNPILGTGEEIQKFIPEDCLSSPRKYRPAPARREADVFFVHPTTSEVGWGCADWDDEAELTEDVVREMSSVFNGCCRIFAPKYRQARFQAYSSAGSCGDQFNIAYEDVKRAFHTYLDEWNPLGPSGRRPFFVAGHGQGSHHLCRLLREEPVDRAMVCAYLIGWFVGEDTLAHRLPFGKSPTQTRCWVSYASSGEHLRRSNPAAYGKAGGYPLGANATNSWTTEKPKVVNPLTFRYETRMVAAEKHGGSLLANGTLSGQGLFGASIDLVTNELLIVPAKNDEFLDVTGHRDPRKRFFSTKVGDYHELDYSLFWVNLRENIELRVKSYTPQFMQHIKDGKWFRLHAMQGALAVTSATPSASIAVVKEDRKNPLQMWAFQAVVTETGPDGDVVYGNLVCKGNDNLIIDAGSKAAFRRSSSPVSPQKGSERQRTASPRRGTGVCLWPKNRGVSASRCDTSLWKVTRLDAGLRLVEIELKGFSQQRFLSVLPDRTTQALSRGLPHSTPGTTHRFTVSLAL
eukprot:TRINITY_DN8640_c0_g1_i4.p1 TRINITY_DN8640_c0_g1~~TRINITY_DN8640_c0_g1_i4.p1  ORF type:complete len:1240 (+),score=231.47 TRINITY_DN8640_c0_g1_i4:87-3722(+)